MYMSSVIWLGGGRLGGGGGKGGLGGLVDRLVVGAAVAAVLGAGRATCFLGALGAEAGGAGAGVGAATGAVEGIGVGAAVGWVCAWASAPQVSRAQKSTGLTIIFMSIPKVSELKTSCVLRART